MCNKFCFPLLGLTFFAMIAAPAHSSVSMQSPVCNVAGIVKTIDTRTVAGKGISQGETFVYTDITLDVSEAEFTNQKEATKYTSNNTEFNCSIITNEQTYQLQNGTTPPEIGECIASKTHFLADGNFMSGNWIYDIKSIDDRFCP